MIINPLTVGPIVGHADADHVRLWGRGELEITSAGKPRRCFGVARIRKNGDADYSPARYFKMNPNFDMTGIALFHDLKADTPYEFQMGYFFAEQELTELDAITDIDWRNADQGRFRTASSDPKATREFIFGSCRYLLRLFGGSWFDDRGDKTFLSINQQIEKGKKVDKLLMVGDQIYADDLNFLAPDAQLDEFLRRYRDAFSQPYIRELMSQVPTYMTLDDHEIEDNWPALASQRDMMLKYPAAIHSYQVYQMSHSPLLKHDGKGKLVGTPDCFYYQFSDGCCDFFVTDTRTEREPEVGADEGDIIGEQQMLALLDWLGDGSGKAKLIVSAVPFFPDTQKENEDKWGGFRKQRDRIIALIRAKKIKRVVFLSGDVHCSMAAELNIGTADKPLAIYSVISSSFYWPYPHMKRRHFQLSGHVASADDRNAYQLGKISEVYSGDNFTRVKVTPKTLDIKVYERKGELLQKIRFQF
ncbi:alkaline phosphatase D family protein [Methylomarinum vadi]|uniref:alkaline phosphatase D family protein n=1 Tax=Methylomarinum vadi TaxID=438855 RepID=UPI0004DF2CD4|nr:alkaline phosphatase D family protein [Methylomarinum vadi]